MWCHPNKIHTWVIFSRFAFGFIGASVINKGCSLTSTRSTSVNVYPQRASISLQFVTMPHSMGYFKARTPRRSQASLPKCSGGSLHAGWLSVPSSFIWKQAVLSLYSPRRRHLICIGIPIVYLRRSWNRLRCILGIPSHARRRLPWWRHQMETFSALLALCAGNSPVLGELPWRRLVTRGFDVFFDLCLNKRLSKQPWGWWFETPSGSLWHHSNVSE